MQVSKARPVKVFCAGQVVAAMEVCAAMPAPATTAVPATAQVTYLRFFDCRWPAMKPHPCSYMPAKSEAQPIRRRPCLRETQSPEDHKNLPGDGKN
ncbi:hypothetical protein Scel_54540 [Streptomyces cellostaticus]|nr:hypothetical protein Scel_54540 [Streptomyces cellostaticus]